MIFARFNCNQRRLVGATFSLSVLAFSVAGCSDGKPPNYPLSGAITFEGKPVPEGTIMFIPSDKRSGTAKAEIVDGKYTLELPAGEKLVKVEASRFIGPEDKSLGVRPRDQYLPDRYNVESKLTTEVKPQNDNVYNLKLQK